MIHLDNTYDRFEQINVIESDQLTLFKKIKYFFLLTAQFAVRATPINLSSSRFVYDF